MHGCKQRAHLTIKQSYFQQGSCCFSFEEQQTSYKYAAWAGAVTRTSGNARPLRAGHKPLTWQTSTFLVLQPLPVPRAPCARAGAGQAARRVAGMHAWPHSCPSAPCQRLQGCFPPRKRASISSRRLQRARLWLLPGGVSGVLGHRREVPGTGAACKGGCGQSLGCRDATRCRRLHGRPSTAGKPPSLDGQLGNYLIPTCQLLLQKETLW